MGVFANTFAAAVKERNVGPRQFGLGRPRIAAWIIDRLRSREKAQPRLSVVERVSLAPRQILALVEADGQRLLVATSQDGAPAFYPLNSLPSGSNQSRSQQASAEGTAV